MFEYFIILTAGSSFFSITTSWTIVVSLKQQKKISLNLWYMIWFQGRFSVLCLAFLTAFSRVPENIQKITKINFTVSFTKKVALLEIKLKKDSKRKE